VILVTGGAGFIGSRLCRALVARGESVVSLDDYSTGSRDNHVAGVIYIEGHTRAIAGLMPVAPSLIFHLGEYARVEASFADRDRVLESNVIGTEAVFDYWLRSRCKLVYAGSSTRFACDGSSSPYSVSKRDNAERLKALGLLSGLPHAITYFFNVYGPGERAGRYGTMIEIFRQCHLEGRKLPIVAPGTQRRNFTHVDDIVDGVLLVADSGLGEFQIGAMEDYSPLDVAHMFGRAHEFLPFRDGNRLDSTIDTRRIRDLGWRQRRRLRHYIDEIRFAGAKCAS
jgi:UDP-glucose 4-epimerase